MTNQAIKKEARKLMQGKFLKLSTASFLSPLLLILAYFALNHVKVLFYREALTPDFLLPKWVLFYAFLAISSLLNVIFYYCWAHLRILQYGSLLDFIKNGQLPVFPFKGQSNLSFFKQADLIMTYYLNLLVWGLIPFLNIYRYYEICQSFMIVKENPQQPKPLKASKDLMLGKKGQFFLLDLSFIPWYVLSFFTFGLLFTWVLPYHRLSRQLFYQSLGYEQVLEGTS